MKEFTLPNLLSAITAASIVSYTGTDGRIKYVNENFVAISGYSKAELIGSDHRIINSGCHPKEFWKQAWLTIKNGDVWRNDVVNRGKHGNLYWVDTFIYPFQDDTGTIVGYFSIRNDITERKNNEIELRRKNELLRKIAWTQSHEFRRPVANIVGLLSLLEASNDDKPIIEEIMKNLKKAVGELDSKIHSIVALTDEIAIVNAGNEIPLKDFNGTSRLKGGLLRSA